MAQVVLYAPHGAVNVAINDSFISTDIPTGMDIVKLDLGVRITDEFNEKTPLRGVRMKVVVTADTYPKANIPIIWYEGESLAFLANTTYTFLDPCRISFGTKVLV